MVEALPAARYHTIPDIVFAYGNRGSPSVNAHIFIHITGPVWYCDAVRMYGGTTVHHTVRYGKVVPVPPTPYHEWYCKGCDSPQDVGDTIGLKPMVSDKLNLINNSTVLLRSSETG